MNLLFRYASIPDNKTKLLLSLRPYGLEYIKAQASSFALSGVLIASIKLDPLNLEQATQLAAQVLEKCNGPISAAKDIARLTLDCPLATVIGAQIISKEMKPFDFVRNEESFRNTILGRFQNIIAGNIGNKNDAESIRKVFRVLALLLPFHMEDETIPKIIEQVEGIQIYEANRLIRLLSGSGVLFKRGGKYRLSPDMLTNYIIDENCIGESGQSTGYAEQIFDVAGNQHIEHILVNLGKLDWQLAKGDTSNNSQLLHKIWKKLNPTSEYSDPHIKAVESVAYYQPKLALGFV